MTEQLYDTNPYRKTFTATVISCEPCKTGCWTVVLDRTAFYPQGSVQASRAEIEAFFADLTKA